MMNSSSDEEKQGAYEFMKFFLPHRRIRQMVYVNRLCGSPQSTQDVKKNLRITQIKTTGASTVTAGIPRFYSSNGSNRRQDL